ncbi:MAG: hypothetical protein ACYS1A_08445 [Planctomycetota bacterium]|jgi:hypothetical protein
MKKNNTIWILSAFVAVGIAGLAIYSLSSRQQGYIKIDTAGAKMGLHGGWFRSKTVSSTAGPVKVNTRVYRPQWLSIVRQQNSDTWRMESFGPWGTLKTIEVIEGQTTVLKPGPPFLVKANVDSRSGRVSIGFAIEGQAGEHYQSSATKNGRRQPAPNVKIIDEQGNTLVSGKFEYG